MNIAIQTLQVLTAVVCVITGITAIHELMQIEPDLAIVGTALIFTLGLGILSYTLETWDE